jgi:RIO-like serine/threonine protein kinase
MRAWNIARTLAANTFERIIAEREMGVLKTLFMKPKRLSHTTDMPTNAVVKTVVNATILIAMKEK